MIVFFSTFSFIFLLFWFVAFVALHSKYKEYSIISHAVSDYAIGRSSKLFLLYLSFSMIAYLFLGIAIFCSRYVLFSIQSLWYLGLTVVCRVGLSVFKTNLEGQKMTRAGIAHYLFAIASFTLLFMFIDTTVADLNHDVTLSVNAAWTVYEILVGIALFFVCITLIPKFRKVFGLFERIFLILGNLWIGICVVLLFIRGIASWQI